MSERYTRLFSLTSPLYAAGAPVMITAGALLKDNQTGKVLAQLKIQNISDKAIKGVSVRILPMDTIGEPLGEPVDFQYLDLNIARDVEFGQKAPISLPNAAIRGFNASVSDVFFVDNTVWKRSGTQWGPFHPAVPLEEAFGDMELVKQYRMKYGEDCRYLYRKEQDLWQCACGVLNHHTELLCHACKREAAGLAALDLEALKADRNKRLETERQKEEEEKAAAALKAKKFKKRAFILAPIAIAAICAGTIIFRNVQKSADYNNAFALMESGDYSRAIAAFESLGDYKDSAAQIQNVKNERDYVQAVHFLEQGEDENAYQVFRQLGSYKDTQEYLSDFLALPTENLYGQDGNEYSTETMKYNEFGQCIEKIESGDDTYTTTTYAYDGENLITEDISYSNGNGSHTTYSYDEEGRCIQQVREVIRSDQDTVYTITSEDYTTTYQYGPDGNLTQETTAHTIVYDNYGDYFVNFSEYDEYISSRTNTKSYTYNSDGKCVKIEEVGAVKGVVDRVDLTTFSYDEKGNCTEELFYYDVETDIANESPRTIIQYKYDEEGKLTNEATEEYSPVSGNLSRKEIREYDAYGNGTQIDFQAFDDAGTVTNQYSRKFQYEYDENGNILSRYNPDDSSSLQRYTYSHFYVPDSEK